MELKNKYVFWDDDNSEKVYGQIVKIESMKDPITHQQKKDKKGRGVSRIVFRTQEQGDVFVRILDTQRPFFEPQLGKRGYICHDHTNNHLNFEGYDPYDHEPVKEPLSLEELFEYGQDEDGTRSMGSVIDEVEDYCNRINELLNKQIVGENEINGAYLRKVRDANIGTVQEIIDLRMRDVV